MRSGGPVGTIKGRAPDQRPRERLLRHGVRGLSDEELLAVVLGGGTRGVSALDLARQLLGDGLVALAGRPAEELLRVRGLGVARVAALQAALELGRRVYREENRPTPVHRLDTPEAAYRALWPLFPLEREEIWLVVLDARCGWRGERCLAVGGIDYAALAPAEVLRAVLRTGFTRFLVAHNHPSGDPTPSEADRQWTARLAEGSTALGFEMVDHLVVARSGFVSLRRLMTGRSG